MEKEKRVTAYVTTINTLVITGELEAERYANSWLAFSNNKRDNKNFLELRNYYDSNKVTVVIDITESHNQEESIKHYKEFFASWGLNTTNARVEQAKKYIIEEYQLDEDNEVYLILE